MKKLARTCIVLLVAGVAIGPSQMLALPLLPACQDCRCYSNCNQLCIVDHFPDPGSHEEICDLWLCNQFPECSELSASALPKDPAFSMIEETDRSCRSVPSSSALVGTDASGEAGMALVP